MIKIIADSKIPFLRGVFEPVAQITYLSPDKMTPEIVKEADALIVRTRTHCNHDLLHGSQVKMIATATIGFDHIDAAYCEEAGIRWRNAPGCNASSVAQYVLSSLLLVARDRRCTLQKLRVALVGVGHVGKSVEKLLLQMGLEVRRCDPPRARQEHDQTFYTLHELASWADVFSFHTPLTRVGDDHTFHLASTAFFEALTEQPVIINTSRGEVIDEQALLQAKEKKQVGELIIDCWANEPVIDRALLEQAFIATPHIAGYSADGKANATRIAAQHIADFFDLTIDLSHVIAPDIEPNQIDMRMHTEEDALLMTYDPREDMQRLRSDMEQFERLRGEYPLRREYLAYSLYEAPCDELDRLKSIGFNCISTV